MASATFVIPGAAQLKVTLTEQADGSIRFDLDNEGDLAADLRGLFFDFNDEELLDNLSIFGADVTGYRVADDSVSNLGGGVNMNGVGAFDIGVLFGTAGIGKDDIDLTSFVLKSSDGPLSLEDLSGVDFGVRFTSVGEEGGAREGSLKLFTQAPEFEADVPPPPPPPPPPPIDFPPPIELG